VGTCAQAIADHLRASGVEHFFLVTGGDHALWVEFRKKGIRQILARSESAAVYMADGYARVKGSAAFVYGQYGPGAANVAGSLAEPWWSSSPVVVLASCMRRPHRYRFEYQELDQIPLFSPVTKWQAEASVPQQVPQLLRAALLHALSGNPGPVYLGIPNDMVGAPLDENSAGGPADTLLAPSRQTGAAQALPLSYPLYRPQPTPGDVMEAARLLAGAERPVFLVGNGIHASRAYEPLRRVVEAIQAPVITSLSGKGAIPETHPLAAGVSGRYSRVYANQCLRQADLVVAVGTRLGGLVTDSYRLLQPGTGLVHVDIDPVAPGFNFPVTLAIQADASAFLQALAAALAEVDLAARREERSRWLARVSEWRAAWSSKLAELAGWTAPPMRPESLLVILKEELPSDALVVADTGYAAAWAGALYEVPIAGRGFIRSDGSLGWAFCAAMGARLASPNRPVVAVTGDGGFGYHVGELETAVRLRLPVVCIVLNNRSLAFEYHIQKLIYGQPVEEVDDYVDVDYGAVARQFGAQGRRVQTPEEFRAALRQALRADGPVVIDALVDKEAIAPVTRYDAIRQREL